MTSQPLPTPLKQLLSEGQPEGRLQRIWLGVAARRSRGRVRLRVGVACATAGAAVLLALGLWSLVGRSTTQRLASIVESPSSIVGTTAPRMQSFGSGAAVTVDPGTQLDVLNQSSQEMLLALRHGVARFDIRPGGTRRWQIECGGTTVEVIGTEFVVERDPHRLRVAVARGKVLVRGEGVPDTVQAVEAGSQLVIPYESRPRSASAAEATVDVGGASSHTDTATLSHDAERTVRSDWRRAAGRKEWQKAWGMLGAEGLAREASKSDDVADLLALADVARLSGHPEQATAPLRQVVQSHSGDSRAALAAFSLGKILLDSMGRAPDAASAFESAVALQLPASLAEDAAVRLVEAYARAQDPVRARAAAANYRTRFPAGRRASEVNRWSPAQ